MIGKPYKTLFKHLVIKKSIIPLGVYRTEMVSFSSLEEESNKRGRKTLNKTMKLGGGFNEDDKKEIKYVITNPSKDFRLKDNDVIFVLA